MSSNLVYKFYQKRYLALCKLCLCLCVKCPKGHLGKTRGLSSAPHCDELAEDEDQPSPTTVRSLSTHSVLVFI